MSVSILWRRRALRRLSAMLLIFASLAVWFGTGCEKRPTHGASTRDGLQVGFRFVCGRNRATMQAYIFPTVFNPEQAYPAWVELHALYAKQ